MRADRSLTPSSRRTALAATLVGIAVLVPTVAWYLTGSRDTARRAGEIEETARADVARAAEVTADRLGHRLGALREAESARPFYHYQNLYHDPRGAAQGLAVLPSPLADGPSDPMVWAHFQIDEAGLVSLPTVSERFPELSTDADFDRFCRVLADLQNGLVVEGMEGGGPAAGDERITVLDRSAWRQIQLADSVYAELTGRRTAAAAPETTRTGDVGVDVIIRVGPLRWHTIVLGGGPLLAALRDVTTPAGVRVQGFAVTPHTLAEWLDPATEVGPVASDAALTVAVPVADTGWYVNADAGPAVAEAAAAGRRVVAEFRRTFALSSAAALMAAVAVVALVAQSDRLAHQRARFAAAAAHELKTPLASLRLHAEMLAEGLGRPDNVATYAGRIVPEVRRLGRVVTNMLDLSRLERGAPIASPAAGDPGPAVSACVERLRGALEGAGMELRVQIDPDLPKALFDRDALCQILDNLLDNAEKYSRGAAVRSVAVTAARIDGGVEVRVADSGPGVPRRLRHALFRPFHRPDDGDAPAGLGLGLALARSLARAQGGELALADAPGEGATFVLTLAAC
ncbi:MAG TPA: HAMP domain-containing sensor histidine kinase [Thermoanaerobaculales bacterium]|nr:HAMP domain-containing sensor histidine kinase [Thermoanaerobaculales bacterium]HPA80134.1 HAMP domain-containing sensor histidine kinase [Thermoanaerobaculales bacterium]HQL30280.1 HAMP domain-containing sensor histidine kinase [Thermoanaerobaculales bacterium]HQN94955.1 HAMP domain-containing sensor histidine kinase [Thermoanaerobaculales bacterium]